MARVLIASILFLAFIGGGCIPLIPPLSTPLVTTTTAATTISAANATTTKSASAITIATATTKTTPDTKPPSPQLTRYCSWRRIDQELQSQGLPVSYNKKSAKGPSDELVAEYLATVVEMQRLTCSHR
nr:uncharacterized protein LOC129266589 [Lytechinus pictus]